MLRLDGPGMTWKGVLLVSVRLPDVVNNVVMDATERGSQAATGERGQAIELFSYLLSLVRDHSGRSGDRSGHARTSPQYVAGSKPKTLHSSVRLIV